MLQIVLYIQYNLFSSWTVGHKPVLIYYFYYSQTLTPHKLTEHHEIKIMICTGTDNSYSNNALNTGGSISGRVISLCVSASGPQNIVKKTQLLLMRIYLCAGTLSWFSPTKKSMSQATWLVHMWRLQNWRFLQDCQSSMMEAAILRYREWFSKIKWIKKHDNIHCFESIQRQTLNQSINTVKLIIDTNLYMYHILVANKQFVS